MNVVKVMGGLGNQLFQYAFSKYLEKYGSVGLDIDFYTSEDNHTEDIPTREFLLDRFDIDFTVTDEKHDIVNEEDFKDQEYHDTYFWGYWQNVDFLKDLHLDIELKDECITDEMREIESEIIKDFDSIGIHVRRGDYVKLGWDLELDYYKSAMDFIKSKREKPRFYIFTDDVEYCENNFQDCRIISIGAIEDFYLMTKCGYNIIANSTFSWWAALLNNRGRGVIQPIDWKYTDYPPRLYGRFM